MEPLNVDPESLVQSDGFQEFAIGSLVVVSTQFHLEDAGPEEWRYFVQKCFTGTVVGVSPRSNLSREFQEQGIAVLPDVPPGLRPKDVYVSPPKYIIPHEWVQKAPNLEKVFLRRVVELLPSDESK